jgi:hypothetical protein
MWKCASLYGTVLFAAGLDAAAHSKRGRPSLPDISSMTNKSQMVRRHIQSCVNQVD